ncbi:MAG: hypothetical protein AAF411_25030 [Myxococcota bacterium]
MSQDNNIRHLRSKVTPETEPMSPRRSRWPVAPGSIAEAFRRWEEEEGGPRHAAPDPVEPGGGPSANA